MGLLSLFAFGDFGMPSLSCSLSSAYRVSLTRVRLLSLNFFHVCSLLLPNQESPYYFFCVIVIYFAVYFDRLLISAQRPTTSISLFSKVIMTSVRISLSCLYNIYNNMLLY
jgi:hypothetical protein